MSSDEDTPLAIRSRLNGSPKVSPNSKRNGLVLPTSPSAKKRLDDKMDVDSKEKVGAITVELDVMGKVNGSTRGKRKAAKPAIKEEESSDSDAPLSKRRKQSKPNGINAESSDEDVPLLASRMSKSRSPVSTKKSPVASKTKAEDSDSDAPLAKARLSPETVKKLSKEKLDIEKKADETAKVLRAQDRKSPATKRKVAVKDESTSDDDAPLIGKKRTVAKKANVFKKEESDEDMPLVKKARASKATVKKETASAAKKGKGKVMKKEESSEAATPGQEGEEDDDEYKWWENQEENDGSIKWTTLEHNGVVFPDPFKPYPKNVKLKYDGVAVNLPIEADEVAGFFGQLLQTDHARNPTFQKNFFKDFQKILEKHGGATDTSGKTVKIQKFEKCDFTAYHEFWEADRAAKKALTPADKKLLKAQKDEMEAPFMYCLLDGRKEKVGNFRVEPPGLFRGRGAHPKTGKVKERVAPEQIVINIGEGAKVPEPPAGHKWKEVRHDNTVTWLAMWQENINQNTKYVMLANTSSLKGQSDFKKFEKARELKKVIDKIRKDYEAELKNKQMEIRQRATAMYFIDKLALRAGNEKDSNNEAETVGCCTLQVQHIVNEPDEETLSFDFLGKDSIRYQQSVKVSKQVWKNIKIFKKEKDPSDMIFDRLNTARLNAHLRSYMPGLTAKVFRTYNASWTMQQELDKIPAEGSVHDKYAAYQLANKMVAILCNHQRTVTANFEVTMAKADEVIKGLRYQKLRLKRMILALEPKRAKKDPSYFQPDDEIKEGFDEWVIAHQKMLIDQEREKISRKFQKDNEKLEANDEKPLPESELKERLKILKEMEKEFKDENKTGKIEPKKGATVEKLEAQIKKKDEMIYRKEIERMVKDENKSIALGTSKQNYIDPRLTVMFCKKHEVPIEKFFPKTLRDKFKWALESADENWQF